MAEIMGPNTAAYLGTEDQPGTLEPGNLADIILLDGDPLRRLLELAEDKGHYQGRHVVVVVER